MRLVEGPASTSSSVQPGVCATASSDANHLGVKPGLRSVSPRGVGHWSCRGPVCPAPTRQGQELVLGIWEQLARQPHGEKLRQGAELGGGCRAPRR